MSDLSYETVWVVAKLTIHPGDWDDTYDVVVEEQAYFDKSYADKRAKHIREHDKTYTRVYPVRFPKILGFAPPLAPELYPPNLTWGTVTDGPGRELIAYHVPWRDPQPRLSQTVSDAWISWRQQQADAGNLDEAGQAGPSDAALAHLYQEDPTPTPATAKPPTQQLELDFAGPVH